MKKLRKTTRIQSGESVSLPGFESRISRCSVVLVAFLLHILWVVMNFKMRVCFLVLHVAL
jgi:hypothetical protein